MEAFRGGEEERLRHRVPLAFAGEPRQRTLVQLGQALVTAASGAALVLISRGHPLTQGFGALVVGLTLDGALGAWRNRFLPPLLMTKHELHRRGEARKLAELKALRLWPHRPYLLRVDLLPELRLVLDWGDARWAVPLTHENWEVLWERLMRQRPELPHWSRHPEVLRALAQGHEVPYYLPPGVEVEEAQPKRLVMMLSGLPLVAYWLLVLARPDLAQVLTGEVVLGTSAALAFLIRRKLSRTRLTVKPPRGRRGEEAR